ncbi:porin [Burkholderia pseudomultivorans]|uniref:Porin n=1 Tax=Burkholderia pseudomultivorans TaxID=1207504 RepID=A0A132EI98_9BURK|nr:porin [Burkholderia pseudomultivorans]KWF30820.1 porin [Burkholderia pseudomultivorans]
MRYWRTITTVSVMTMATYAHAQSSVMLYGVIDYGINYVNDAQKAVSGGRTGKTQWATSSSIMQGNRWGLRGNEDLGGGYKAVFVLESGMDIGTGTFQQGGALFGRQAYVGIASPYGTVTLGRQYDSVVDSIGPITGAVGNGTYSLHGNDIDNFGNTYRVNNAVKYTSPTFGGFRLTGLYSFGGVAGSFGTNSIFSVGGTYNNGPVTVAAAFLDVRNPNRSYWGDNPNGSATANNLGATSGVQVNPVYGGFASAHTYQVLGAAAQYSGFGFIVGANYSHIAFRDLNDPASGDLTLTNPRHYTGNAIFNSYSVFGRYAITPLLWVSGAYDYLAGGAIDGKDGAKYHLFNLSLDYFLSKRTDVYFMANYQIASGVDSTGQSAVASYLTITPSNTSRQLLFRMGMRHLF